MKNLFLFLLLLMCMTVAFLASAKAGAYSVAVPEDIESEKNSPAIEVKGPGYYERKETQVNVGLVQVRSEQRTCYGSGCKADEEIKKTNSVLCANCEGRMGFNAGTLGFTARMNEKEWGDPRIENSGAEKPGAKSQTILVNLHYRGVDFGGRDLSSGGEYFYHHDQSSSLDFGGTRSELNELAQAESRQRPKRGFAFGITHHNKESFGVATSTPAGLYGKTHVGLDIVAHTNSNAEGNHLILNGGFSAGLDAKTRSKKFRFLAGPLIQGLLGVQTLNRSRFIGQFQAGAETTLLFQASNGVFFALRGQYSKTIFVQEFGGDRQNWRAGMDFNKKDQDRPLNFYVGAIYQGNQIEGLPAPAHGNLDVSGESRKNHSVLGTAGVSF